MFSPATIFVRTPQGRISTFDTASALAHDLKALLRAIDGKTTVHTLQLHYGHTLAAMLEQLASAGLIEDKKLATHFTDSSTTLDDALLAASAPAVTAPQPAPKAAHWAATMPSSLEFVVPSLSLEALEANKVRQATDLMATFVLTHLPDQAFALLKELESLRWLNQLQASLPSYEIAALSVGQAGREHMARLKGFIQSGP
jgi:hypothetical protein